MISFRHVPRDNTLAKTRSDVSVGGADALTDTAVNVLSPSGLSPLALYRARIAAGALAADPAQEDAALRLDRLAVELAASAATVPPSVSRSGFRLRFGRRAEQAASRPRGLYIVGAVGRGKSMLMDLFFEAAPIDRKRRIHFHRFMQEAHAAMHAARQRGGDPIPPLADAVARDGALLCFDEFQINDIADALILGRLFEALFARGVVVVATSNVRPERLFQDRPGADAFKPFIAILLRHVDVLELRAARDYRRERRIEGETWHAPADARADRRMDDAFALLTEGETVGEKTLPVFGRGVIVPRAAAGVARFDFDELCARPLGPGDFLAIAQNFHTLLIDRIPRLGAENIDRARRFVTLVDALYEARVKLVASADTLPDRIYERGDEAFLFERAASRLAEMQSAEYRALPHVS